ASTDGTLAAGSLVSPSGAFLFFEEIASADGWILSYVSDGVATLASGHQLRVQQDPVHNNDLTRKAYVDNLVKDGTLTLSTGDGLTGSALFSANQSTNSTFTVGLGVNLANLNALNTNGFVKKTGVNTWAIDTNTYLTGTGTTGYLPKWGSSSSLNDSVIYQDGNNRIGIGTTTMDVKLVVDGGFAAYGNSAIRPDSGGNGVFNVWRDIVVGDTVNDV